MKIRHTIHHLLLLALCGGLSLMSSSAQESTEPAPEPPAQDAAAPVAPEAATDSPPPAEPAAPDLAQQLGPAVPQGYKADRYASTWERNPFLVEVTAAAINTVSFAQDWALTGLTVKPDGNSMAYIRNKQTQEFKRITPEPDADGFQLVKANPNPMRKDASVEVKKGAETATLKYDEVAPAPAAAPRVPMPGQQPVPVPGQPPANTIPGRPGMPPNATMNRPGLPQPGMPAQPNQAYPGGVQPGQPPVATPGVPPVIQRSPSQRRRLLIPPQQPAPGAPQQ
jgi:hypothetical protein